MVCGKQKINYRYIPKTQNIKIVNTTMHGKNQIFLHQRALLKQ